MKVNWISKVPALITLNVVLFGGLAGQIVYRYLSDEDRESARMYMASWKDRPDSMESTVELTERVVHGKVVNIRKAEPLRVEIEGEPNNVDTIPVEIVTLQLVNDAAVGRGKKGERIEVFHTGHSDAVMPSMRRDRPTGPPPERPDDAVDEKDAGKAMTADDRKEHMGVLFSGVMDDPAYKKGEEYVLFLREGPELTAEGAKTPTQAIVSPEGRYKVGRDNALLAMSPRAFAQGYNGKKTDELTGNAKQAATKRNRPEPN